MGRPWGGGKPTPASYFELDIRWLKRKGMLREGMRSTLREVVNGKARGVLDFLAGEHEVVVIIAGRRECIGLDETAVHLGGSRPWFRCRCGRRCAKIYGSPYEGGSRFACRQCKRIAYPSQNEDPRYRPTRRAQRIRQSMGGTANLSLPFPPKPKGMHCTTYERACAKATEAEHESVAGMMAAVSRLQARIGR